MQNEAVEQCHRSVISAIWNRLKPLGFSKSGVSFHLEKNGDWAVVNVQRWRGPSSDRRFTVNLGVYSRTLAHFYGRASTGKPAEYQCHWRRRPHQLRPGDEEWWRRSADNEWWAIRS